MDYDVLFIGSGQGAWNGAIPMSQAGLKVCVVEEGQFGGTCTNRGCNAKITLDRPIELLQQVKQLQGKGFDSIPTINWPDLMAHKHEVIDGLAFSNEQKLSTAGVAIIKGHATFIDDHTLQIADQTVTADKIVIVSGQRPHRLDIPGRELMHDSTDFLVIPEMPQHLTIIGGGYVGMEFASIANAAGAQVTVILRGHQPLKDFYQPHVTQLIATMRAAGITFNYDVNIQAVTQNKNGLTLHGANGFTLDTDYIIDATGRIPNTEALNLDKNWYPL
ncbi:FAD-dependent oxidoreductase [Agrilactobacillus fermenti]|uniref:FAD-dependent oxidoreductase n=1 Tax=Agrilactobacillus fermenti TaxID=2586909 RepID=UPI003A5B9381